MKKKIKPEYWVQKRLELNLEISNQFLTIKKHEPKTYAIGFLRFVGQKIYIIILSI